MLSRAPRPSTPFSSLVGGGGLAFFLASSFANGSNFVFHMVMSRLLGPATYGALGSLLGLITVVTFAVGALQAAVTQAVAIRVGRTPLANVSLALRRHSLRVLTVAIGAFALTVALSPALEGYLHLGSLVPVILLGLFIAISVLALLPQGVLLGRLSFRVVAAALVSSAVVRLVSGTILVELGFGLDGAVLSSVLSGVVLLAVLVWPLRYQMLRSAGEHVAFRPTSAALAVSALGGWSALVGIDTFLARHYLGGAASGHYAAAATAARIAMFLPSAVALIAFPKLVAEGGIGIEARRVLTHALLAVAILGACAAVVMLAVPHLVIAVLFGSKYQSAAGALRILAPAAAGLGMISVLVYAHLARQSVRSLTGWLGVVLAVVLISTWHSSLEVIAWAMLGVTVFTLLTAAVKVVPGVSNRRLAVDWDPGQSELDLTIVVPYFNAGTQVRATIEQSIAVLEDLGIRFEIIAVSDGSTDGSDEALDGLQQEVFRCVRLPFNEGKGQALRVGLSKGRGAYLGFIDADGDIPVSQMASFISLVNSHHPDVIVGSKRHPMSEVVYPPLRRLYSWGYQQLVRVLFRLRVRDTQTGLKLIRREVLVSALPRMLEKRFAFDLELLVVAHRLGYRRFFEAPITIRERMSSTISVSTVWKMLLDTLAIFYRLRILRYYDNAPFLTAHWLPFESPTPLHGASQLVEID